jgi:uncharacterized protein (DUF885 family)
VSQAGFRELVVSWLDLKWQLDPVAATAAGVGTHDVRLGTYARRDIRALVAACKSMSSAFEALDVDGVQEQIDVTAVLNDLRVTIARFEQERPHELNPEFHLTHLLGGLFALMMRADQPLEARGKALAGRLREAPRFLDDAQSVLTRPPRVFTDTARQVARGGASLLRQAIPEFAATLPVAQRQEVEEAIGPARDALQDFSDFLAGELLDRSDGDFAIGRDAFDFRLHFEHALRDTAPELLRYGESLVAEVEADLARRAEALAPGTPWRELSERLRESHPTREKLVAAYAGHMERARVFVAEHGLVGIPDGALEVVATPSFMLPLIPFAAYDPPGAFAEDRTGYFYVSVPDETGLKDHCSYEIPTTALHEGYPGHHLQFLKAYEQASPVRRIVGSPIMVEGWALYCEQLLAEHGFLTSPEEQFFQKLALLWRAARIVLDVKLHTAGMTVEEGIAYLMDKIGGTREAAESEVRRYCATPGYNLCYAVGLRELLKLREDARVRDGPKFTLRRFHEEVLSYGGLPVSLTRWGMGMTD